MILRLMRGAEEKTEAICNMMTNTSHTAVAIVIWKHSHYSSIVIAIHLLIFMVFIGENSM